MIALRASGASPRRHGRRDSVALHILIKLSVPATLGFFANLVANTVSDGQKLASVPGRLGWWNLLLPLGVGLLIFDLMNDILTQRAAAAAERNAHLESLKRLKENNRQIISSLLQMIGRSPRRGNVNVHLFYADVLDGRRVLRKDRQVYYECEDLPHNYSLDVADPDTDELVICESFRSDEIVYEELPATHPERYNARIKNKVDPQITWVLAIPMHRENDAPVGVLCAFGNKRVLADAAVRRSFQSLAVGVTDVIVRLKAIEEEEERATGRV
ncbi:hypothetical protein HNP84_010149 [Thermocatellispora tengchongensis]|uniref:GAF domain-containing protein n=1 Tax=Thermocatellispora tengchongensis TaxID=1073253 RepID=A0A840PMV4_9ACTN|nr:hypothetical protein [Thermocatellispora tengchongensis]MBB5140382.1 hypothetical protein [Thermocatellispora tengchongensis]